MQKQPAAMKRNPFRSPRQVAERWGKSRATIIRAIQSGRLHAVRLGNRGHYLIPESEIRRVECGESAS